MAECSFIIKIWIYVCIQVLILNRCFQNTVMQSKEIWMAQHIPTGGLFVGGFTKTWTSAEEDCPELSVTFRTNVYIPSSKFDSWRYGVRVFYKEWYKFHNMLLFQEMQHYQSGEIINMHHFNSLSYNE